MTWMVIVTNVPVTSEQARNHRFCSPSAWIFAQKS